MVYQVHSATGVVSEHDDLLSAYHAWQAEQNPDDNEIVFVTPAGTDHE